MPEIITKNTLQEIANEIARNSIDATGKNIPIEELERRIVSRLAPGIAGLEDTNLNLCRERDAAVISLDATRKALEQHKEGLRYVLQQSENASKATAAAIEKASSVLNAPLPKGAFEYLHGTSAA